MAIFPRRRTSSAAVPLSVDRSLSARYAFECLAHLARLPAGRSATVGELAARAKLPPSFLAKVLRRLVKKGLVGAKRGPRGGFILAREPGTICALDVLDAAGVAGP